MMIVDDNLHRASTFGLQCWVPQVTFLERDYNYSIAFVAHSTYTSSTIRVDPAFKFTLVTRTVLKKSWLVFELWFKILEQRVVPRLPFT